MRDNRPFILKRTGDATVNADTPEDPIAEIAAQDGRDV
jgi:hypothetical protein